MIFTTDIGGVLAEQYAQIQMLKGPEAPDMLIRGRDHSAEGTQRCIVPERKIALALLRDHFATEVEQWLWDTHTVEVEVYRKGTGSWNSSVRLPKKPDMHLGSFETQEHAIANALEAAIRYVQER